MYFWGKIAPDEKITVYITCKFSASLDLNVSRSFWIGDYLKEDIRLLEEEGDYFNEPESSLAKETASIECFCKSWLSRKRRDT